MTRFLLSLLLLSLPTQAELYKWTDEQGQVHFGDRPPVDQKVQPHQVDVQNNDFDYLSEESASYLQRVEQNKAISQQKKQQSSQKSDGARSQQCQQARASLKKLQGRVVFYDEQGNTFAIPEKERKARASQLEKKIKRYCS